MKKTIIILFIFIVSLIVYLVVKNNNKMKVELEKCVDGDTAWFKIDNKIKKYRFLSIDTMENKTKFGELTSQYVCNILSNANNIK